MHRLLIFVFLVISFLQQISSQVTQSLWVGESYTCDGTSAMMGLTSDKSWSISGGYFSLSGSGSYRIVTISQYFSGTASITFSWKERLTSTSQWRSRSKTWYFRCRNNQVFISPSSMTLSVGEDAYVSYSHQYDNSYTNAADAYFSSSNPTIATVNEHTGKVIAKSPGITYINVYSKISSDPPSCKVIVREVDVQSVSIPNTISVVAGETTQLTNTVYPSNATVKSISWYSNNTSVATVNSSGLLTAVKHGIANVYCIINNTIKSNELTVNVLKSTLKISASKESGLLQKGTMITLSANEEDAEIYYTIDGSTPTINSIHYKEPVVIDKNLTLKAVACHEDYNTSEVLVRKFETTSLQIEDIYPDKVIREYMIPYIKFNSLISKGESFDLIKLSTSIIENALDKIILSDSILYLIPQKSTFADCENIKIVIPEGCITNDKGEPCIAIDINLSMSTSNSPYSLYAKEVYAGRLTSSALLSDGTLLNWGAIPSSKGGYSYGTAYDLDLASSINDHNVKKSCSGSFYHNAHIDKDDNLWTWGYNEYGCIGNGKENTYISHKEKFKVMNNVKDVACGGAFGGYTLALTKDGELYGWGENINHQLTDSNQEKILTPNSIYMGWSSTSGGIEYIYANSRTSYVITNTVSNVANALKFIGMFEATVNDKEKALIACNWPTISDNVALVSANHDELPFFIKSDNTLWKCDNNIDPSSLNYEYGLNYDMPAFPFCYEVRLIKVADSVKYITGGSSRGMYIKEDGSLWSWGEQDNVIGISNIMNRMKHTTVYNAGKIMDDVKSVSLNNSAGYCLILKEDGSIWGCGNNELGNVKSTKYSIKEVSTPELLWQSIKAPSATNIRINSNKLVIGIGEVLPLQLIVEPSDAYCKNIIWRSSDESIAIVSQRGIVTGISEGETVINATIESNEGIVFETSCEIIVKNTTSAITQVQTNNISYQINNSILRIKNLQPASLVSIYEPNGFLYYQEKVQSKETNIFLVKKGVYIVKIGNFSARIVNTD